MKVGLGSTPAVQSWPCEWPELAHLARWRALPRRSLDRTDSGRSASVLRTALHAPIAVIARRSPTGAGISTRPALGRRLCRRTVVQTRHLGTYYPCTRFTQKEQ